MSYGPTYDNFLLAARNVLNALDYIGQSSSCLIGGMATRLHGVRRDIKDLDIVILRPGRDAKSIQQALIKAFPDDFYLVKPQDRAAKFMKLFYDIPRTNHSIKVDLLLSTTPEVEIPSGFHQNHFEIINGLRVAPLYFVLYHKLVGWEMRHTSDEEWREEIADGQDKEDILSLCDLAYDDDLEPLSKSHMGGFYLDNFEKRVDWFIDAYNGVGRKKFRRIGFDV